MALNPFQKEKYHHLFRQFYDSNKNGVITHSDFVDMLRDLQKMRNWGPGDSRLKKASQTLDSAWTALKHGADANKDQKVTLDEWENYWGEFIAKSKAAADGWPSGIPWIKEYMNFWFDLMDTSGDGLIDEKEFTQVCTHFGTKEADVRAAFKKFATKPVDRKYFGELWLQYMTAEDMHVPGNFVFGRVNWN